MKTSFLQPRFLGARFDEHTLPLEVARDLAAYESLVIELAKHLFLQEHPDRQRVPKGFASDFHLHLERVDEGSAKPMISVVMAGALALGVGVNDYFERARDLITLCVGSEVGHLPSEFPQELLIHFNQIGRSLLPDERIELPGPGGAISTLTQAKRKELVLAADTVYEREVELTGSIGEADWEKSTFRLRMSDGSQATIPMPEHFHSKAREFGGRARHQVAVRGIATFDSWDKLQKVLSIDSLEISKNYQLASRFDELTALEDGWFDGKGSAPIKANLLIVTATMANHYPERLPVPAIVPTPEGNLLFEWNLPGDPSVDVDLSAMRGYFHSFGADQREVEQDFNLGNENDWKGLFDFLQHHLGSVRI
ncbi:MAG: hypothetical protein HYZ13_04210 [Acidobacteria bacterium]|nr:hypothetical protein [Acidobacteriota bacterium]